MQCRYQRRKRSIDSLVTWNTMPTWDNRNCLRPTALGIAPNVLSHSPPLIACVSANRSVGEPSRAGNGDHGGYHSNHAELKRQHAATFPHRDKKIIDVVAVARPIAVKVLVTVVDVNSTVGVVVGPGIGFSVLIGIDRCLRSQARSMSRWPSASQSSPASSRPLPLASSTRLTGTVPMPISPLPISFHVSQSKSKRQET